MHWICTARLSRSHTACHDFLSLSSPFELWKDFVRKPRNLPPHAVRCLLTCIRLSFFFLFFLLFILLVEKWKPHCRFKLWNRAFEWRLKRKTCRVFEFDHWLGDVFRFFFHFFLIHSLFSDPEEIFLKRKSLHSKCNGLDDFITEWNDENLTCQSRDFELAAQPAISEESHLENSTFAYSQRECAHVCDPVHIFNGDRFFLVSRLWITSNKIHGSETLFFLYVPYNTRRERFFVLNTKKMTLVFRIYTLIATHSHPLLRCADFSLWPTLWSHMDKATDGFFLFF